LQYRPEIDGLRALAVVPVIFFHAGFSHFSGGYVGVDIFFVISGYLITSIITSDLKKGRFSIKHFYERRMRRILPALYLVCFCTTLVAYFALLPSDLSKYGESLLSIPLFISNFLFWSERGYFGQAIDLKPLVHTWSLAVEEQFYIFYPLLLFTLYKLRHIISVMFLLIIALISFIASWYLTQIHFETAFYLPFARAWELLAGALCALYVNENRTVQAIPKFLRELFSLLGIGLIFYAILTFDSNTPFPGIYASVPVIGASLLLVFSSHLTQSSRFLSHQFFVGFGLISYSLYLWHQPVFALFRYFNLDQDYSLTVTFPLILVLSYLSWRFVENPCRKLSFVSSKAVFWFSGLASVFMISVGMTFYLNNGFVERYTQNDQALLRQFATIGNYNQERFNSLELAKFKNTNKKKIFLTGDSHAKDLLNVIFEGGMDRDFQFSTKQINSECGNLYLHEDFQHQIPANRIERCRLLGWYERQEVRALIADADEIWLNSAWLPWVADLLPKSVNNLEKEFGKKVRVFGIKDFGPIYEKAALKIPAEERPAFRQQVNNGALVINKAMREKLPKTNFVELLNVFCNGSTEQCQIFTDDGLLVSPDGNHLTELGAKKMSNYLNHIVSDFD
jgi:peptidoglycan/LPS O-acetylase OafA/YrhL